MISHLAHHGRVGPALVHEDQPVRVHTGQLRAEFVPAFLDVRAALLGGARDLLLERQSPLLQGATEGHGAASDTEPLAQFFQRGVGLLSDQLSQPLQVLRSEFGGVSSAMGFGLEGARAAVELQQPDDEGEADQEATSNLAQGTLPALDGLEVTRPSLEDVYLQLTGGQSGVESDGVVTAAAGGRRAR